MSNTLTQSINGKARVLLTVLLIAVLAVVLYREALLEVVDSVLHREGSSHGVFVPLIAAYCLWFRWEQAQKAELRLSPLAGVVGLALGGGLLLASSVAVGPSLAALSFLALACGIIAGLLGWELFKALSFPLLYLATMIPLPEGLYLQVAEGMRSLSTAGLEGVLHLFGVPFYREGFDICYNDSILTVSPGCSGMRYLLSYLVFGLAYAFVFKKNFFSRAAVVLATIPIAVVGGVLRLSVIFLAARFINPALAEPRPHILLSWAVFVLVFIAALGLDRGIERKMKS